MVADVVKILTKEGQRLSDQIKANTPKVTGKTANSVKYDVSQDGAMVTLRITAKPFFKVVETGRKPTSQGATKGSPTLVEAIKEWLRAKGEVNLGVAYYIAKRIHKQGTKLYQRGGRTDVFSNVLTDSELDRITESLQSSIANDILQDTLDFLKKQKITNGSNS